MKLYKYFAVLLFCTCCSSKKVTNNSFSLSSIVKSAEFEKNFKICKSENDTLKIYNNTDEMFVENNFRLDCEKMILIEKSNLKIDINTSEKNRVKKIVITKFEKAKNGSVITFLNTKTNFGLQLFINKNEKIKIIGRGNY